MLQQHQHQQQCWRSLTIRVRKRCSQVTLPSRLAGRDPLHLFAINQILAEGALAANWPLHDASWAMIMSDFMLYSLMLWMSPITLQVLHLFCVLIFSQSQRLLMDGTASNVSDGRLDSWQDKPSPSKLYYIIFAILWCHQVNKNDRETFKQINGIIWLSCSHPST